MICLLLLLFPYAFVAFAIGLVCDVQELKSAQNCIYYDFWTKEYAFNAIHRESEIVANVRFHTRSVTHTFISYDQ